MAPLLMDRTLSPTEAWPILRSFAVKHKVITKLNPLFSWLTTVAQVENDKLRVDIFTLLLRPPLNLKLRRVNCKL